MKSCFIFCLSLLLSGLPAQARPVPIIFDTDITGDVDDVLALAMLHSLADRVAPLGDRLLIEKKV